MSILSLLLKLKRVTAIFAVAKKATSVFKVLKKVVPLAVGALKILKKLFVVLALVTSTGCDEADFVEPHAEQVQVYLFGAEWCYWCHVAKQQIDKATLSAPVTYVDVVKEPGLAAQYAVATLPVFVVLSDGVETYRTSNASDIIARYSH